MINDLEKKQSLVATEPADTNFFITAMGVCSDHLQVRTVLVFFYFIFCVRMSTYNVRKKCFLRHTIVNVFDEKKLLRPTDIQKLLDKHEFLTKN